MQVLRRPGPLHLGWSVGLLAFMLLTMILTALPAWAEPIQLDPNMDRTWKRTDQLVAQGGVQRSWVWGPEAFTITTENYDSAPGIGSIPPGKRLVAYYDKSRMEINNPNGNRDDKYFVTNGLLVKELISGNRALGDNRYEQHLAANIPVVGDGINPDAPTYGALRKVASLNLGQNTAPRQTGQTVTTVLNYDGTVSQTLDFAHYNITNAVYDATFGHNIPKVFWDYMNSTGPVLENGQVVTAPVVDWVFSTGYPLTEAYWTHSRVGGLLKDVLFQCFERRCFSYTPSNPAGFQVEMGNVGRHYYNWRYELNQVVCDQTPIRGFGKLWSENFVVKEGLSCPSYGGEVAAQVRTQQFEHGEMILVDTPRNPNYYLPYDRTIFVLFDDGTRAVVEANWQPGQPNTSGDVPPLGRYEPTRDFGKVWRDATALKVRERLGWAIQPEQNGSGALQGFYNGQMIYASQTNQIWVVYNNAPVSDAWAVYPNTFFGS